MPQSENPTTTESKDAKRNKPSFIPREYKPEDKLYAQIFSWESNGFGLIPSPENPHKCASVRRSKLRPEPERDVAADKMIGRWVTFRYRQFGIHGKHARIDMAYLIDGPPAELPPGEYVLHRIVPKKLRGKTDK